MDRDSKRIRRTNKFLKGFALFLCVVALIFGGYMLLGHEESKANKWFAELQDGIESLIDEGKENNEK